MLMGKILQTVGTKHTKKELKHPGKIMISDLYNLNKDDRQRQVGWWHLTFSAEILLMAALVAKRENCQRVDNCGFGFYIPGNVV